MLQIIILRDHVLSVLMALRGHVCAKQEYLRAHVLLCFAQNMGVYICLIYTMSFLIFSFKKVFPATVCARN